MVTVKVCGVTREEDLESLVELGVPVIGLNFYPGSKRYLSPERGRELVQALRGRAEVVGLFIDQPAEQIAAQALWIGLDAVQTYDLPLQAWPGKLRQILTFRIRGRADLSKMETSGFWHHESLKPRAILLDAWVDGAWGGTGQAIPWNELADFSPGCPWWLAGGLTAVNVAQALESCQPDGVDVASGVESAPGVKDRRRLTAFLDAIRDRGPKTSGTSGVAF